MPGDNNQEMFPIVDEQGNITGAATRGECHSSSRFQFGRRFVPAKASGMERYPAGEVGYSRWRTCRFGRERRDRTQTGGPRRTRYHGLYSRTANQLCIRIGS